MNSPSLLSWLVHGNVLRGWLMVFVNLRDCQHSGLDGKQRWGIHGNPGQSVLPPIKRLVGRDRGRVVGKPEVIRAGLSGLVMGSRIVFTDEAALRQCRSGWMTRYRKLSD